MSVPAPHFLLFSEARSTRAKATPTSNESGHWHFVLESVDGASKLEAADEEPEVDAERLELLAVVRGLEALDQPSQVTLVTHSRSVSRGIRFGIDHWRENAWQWECFGEMTPIKDSDLWRRVDQALQFHDVRCRTWRFDQAEGTVPQVKISARHRESCDGTPVRRHRRFLGIGRRLTACFGALRPSPRKPLDCGG